MIIKSIRHKGLKRLIVDDDRAGFQPPIAVKLLKMVAALQDMDDIEQLHELPAWKAHQLTGDRNGTWSLHVTKNWRLTFDVESRELDIVNLDYEDYH